jgi:TonB family protein
MPHRDRDLFGTRRTGSTADHIREVALAPTMQQLAESNHMQPAGSGRHDAAVASRAAESFAPVRSIPNLGNAVSRAPRVGLPPAVHQPSPGELAAADGLDGAHANSFTMMSMIAVPPPPVHLVRAEVEVDQDATGAIRGARVVTASGVPGFDEAALRAIQEALPEVTNVQSREGRRSRWAFEVSESQGTLAGIAGGGNQGWRTISESSNGMQLRYRVRMVRATRWQGS